MPDVRATYRVQLQASFGFRDAAAIAGYLGDLGVTHLYCSPYFQARPGSTHGYDVTDHGRLNPELGGEDAWTELVAELEVRGLGHILDIVPNHMAIAGRSNRWWWDVLKHGKASRYAGFFDIDWDPPEPKLRGKILLPVLADHYGRVLASGGFKIARDEDEPVVTYHEHVFPLSPESSARFVEATPAALDELNSDTARLHHLLERQHYRLAFWRTASQELDYRRFFAINDLVALRMDDPEVFDRVHELVVDMVRRGALDGVRVDHVDGLRDPQAYLDRLRSKLGTAYIVVEKILEPEEALPASWRVEGTTGYEFLNLAQGLFVDSAGEKPFTAIYEDFTGGPTDLRELRRDCKVKLLRNDLASDLARLTKLFVDVCEEHLGFRDYTRAELRGALEETIVAFPVYRTYVSPEDEDVADEDVQYIDEAIAEASARRPDIDPDLFAFLHEILLLEHRGLLERSLAMRVQQTTGPVMAKGVEDTLFYVYNRLVCLNEVGGDPGLFGIAPEDFHRANVLAQKRWPSSMLTSSTHDTKRSEDVRARIALLSEIPQRWADAVRRWSEMNDKHRTGDLPDPNMEYLLYQTLVGAWPLSVERAVAYMTKAAKEAKVHTSWVRPDEAYEDALRSFVERVLSSDDFTTDLASFVEPLVEPGWITSLAQTLLKLTCPGVPDLYQGSELWDFSLVDPDNRRPVDYGARAALLRWVRGATPEEVWKRAEEGAPKLYLIARTLDVRKRLPDSFAPGSSYVPLTVTGELGDHVVAYRRDDVVAVLPRLVLGVGNTWGGGILDIDAQKAWTDWKDTVVTWPPGEWLNELTDEDFAGSSHMAAVFERFPVALLTRH